MNVNNVLKQLLCLAALLSLSNSYAAPTLVPESPAIAAKSYLLEDFNSGQILVEGDVDKRIEPASLTKLLTAYIVFDEIQSGNITLEDQVHISEKAWRTPGSRTFIEVGSQVSVKDLLRGMIIQSGNDATVALAEYVAGSEDAFASLMNQYADTLGMENSHFTNSTGLPNPEHYTTARDLADLTRQLIRNFPEYYTYYSVKKFTYNDITQYNRNKLLWHDDHVDGVKTGHTESAGYCLITSAQQEDMRLISVVIGADSEDGRASESQKLLNYGFRFFRTHRLYAAGEALTSVRVWKGNADKLSLGLNEDLFVTIPRGQYENLNASMEINSTITAPVTKGRRYGTVKVMLQQDNVAQRPLLSLQDIAEGGLFQRLSDEVMLLFQ